MNLSDELITLLCANRQTENIFHVLLNRENRSKAKKNIFFCDLHQLEEPEELKNRIKKNS